jgi:hypothetical protein
MSRFVERKYASNADMDVSFFQYLKTWHYNSASRKTYAELDDFTCEEVAKHFRFRFSEKADCDDGEYDQYNELYDRDVDNICQTKQRVHRQNTRYRFNDCILREATHNGDIRESGTGTVLIS